MHLNWINMSSMIAFDVRFISQFVRLLSFFLSVIPSSSSYTPMQKTVWMLLEARRTQIVLNSIFRISYNIGWHKWVYRMMCVQCVKAHARAHPTHSLCLCAFKIVDRLFLLTVNTTIRSLRKLFCVNRFFSFELATNASGLRNVVDWSRCDIIFHLFIRRSYFFYFIPLISPKFLSTTDYSAQSITIKIHHIFLLTTCLCSNGKLFPTYLLHWSDYFFFIQEKKTVKISNGSLIIFFVSVSESMTNIYSIKIAWIDHHSGQSDSQQKREGEIPSVSLDTKWILPNIQLNQKWSVCIWSSTPMWNAHTAYKWNLNIFRKSSIDGPDE